MNNTVDRDSYIVLYFVFMQRLQRPFRFLIKKSEATATTTAATDNSQDNVKFVTICPNINYIFFW